MKNTFVLTSLILLSIASDSECFASLKYNRLHHRTTDHENKLFNKREVSITIRKMNSSWLNNNSDKNNSSDITSLLSSDLSSIVIGTIGLLIIVFHRLSISSDDYDMLAQQSRMDLIAAFAAGGVLLNGVSALDITSVASPTVILQGSALDLDEVVMSEEGDSNKWALQGVLQATPAKCAVLLNYREEKWSVSGYSGYELSSDASDVFVSRQNTAILNRFLSKGYDRESYLPTLQNLPGRIEFTYLPSNTQEVLLLPCDTNKDGEEDSNVLVLVLGGDTAKSFSPKDIAWCRTIASKISL